MAQLQTITIKAPGFGGLNTQDSPVSMPIEYASQADNCVIDQFGRIAARKGYNVITAPVKEGGLEVEPVTQAYFRDEDGNETVYSCDATGVYRGTTAFTVSYTTDVTAGNYQMVQLDDTMYFAQAGHDLLLATAAGSASAATLTVDTLGNDIDQPNVAMAAFGRLWLADTNDFKNVVWWSDLLDGETYNSGTAGRINLDDVWPDGKDEVTALAAHNGFLVIFGRHSIVVYSGAEDPATMVLADTIAGVGCVARDSVQSAGNDLIFLSAQGVRSFGRTIQEESLPNRDLSATVRDDIVSRLSGDNSAVKSCYSPEEGFYVLFFPGLSEAYVFDLRRSLDNGGNRATRWPNCPFNCMVRNWSDGTLYVGGSAGVGTYANYTDNGETYQMKYYTHQMHFDQPANLKFLKKIRPIIIGSSNSTTTIRWSYDFEGVYQSASLSLADASGAEYGIAEYGEDEFGPSTALNIKQVNANGSGLQVEVGLDVDINGSEFSVQELTLYATMGRTAW